MKASCLFNVEYHTTCLYIPEKKNPKVHAHACTHAHMPYGIRHSQLEHVLT